MATMNYITTAKQSADTEVNVNATSAPTFTDPIKDDVTSLLKANGIHHPQQLANDAAARKKYFANEANRKAIKIKSDDIVRFNPRPLLPLAVSLLFPLTSVTDTWIMLLDLVRFL